MKIIPDYKGYYFDFNIAHFSIHWIQVWKALQEQHKTSRLTKSFLKEY